METILRGLLIMATAGALALPVPHSTGTSASRGRAIAPSAPTRPTAASFAVNQAEAYLTDDGIAYIRPGVKIKINSITNVAAGKKPVVDFNLTDSFDQPLDRNGKMTPGPIAPGFILSQWNPDTRYYKTFTLRTRSGVTNPAADQGGTYTDLEMGHYKYNFGTAMPSDLSSSATLTLGVYARRTLSDIIGKDYYADNVLMDFRPDGGTAAATWAAMNTANTCNKCHDPLALHGGTRRDTELCMQCHNNQVAPDSASGQSFDGKVFFHKLHMGADLPSVQAGKPYSAGGDWSTVAFPQDIRNCTNCHDPKATEASIWYTRPTRAACGSCHDNINWTTGDGHVAGAMADDSACAKCHVADSGQEFDASVKGAHTIPLKSKQLKGLKVSIASVSNVKAGQKPTVVLKITNNDGSAVDGSKLTRFAPYFSGPTSSYTYSFRESTRAATAVFDSTAGTTTYTFDNAIPATASGTIVFTGDFYRNVMIKRADGGADIQVRESAMNPFKYAAISGTSVQRRSSVTIAQCNACHDMLGLHGGQRMATENCVICHNPTATDGAKPAAESISFQRMIHRIHTGEELTQTYAIGNFSANEVRYPGDTQDCRQCHTASGYLLPLATGIDSVTTPKDYFSPQPPATAACLGCHDNQDAAAHAYLNTTNFGGTGNPAEACATCHGAGKDWGVDKVHAR